MRFLALLTFLLFCAFALIARWYFVCELRGLCKEEPPVIEDIRLKNLQLTEADTVVLLEGYDQFAFDSARISPRLNENNIQFLDTLASILQADSTKNLSIVGRFRVSEKDIPGAFLENLGLERADSIRKLLVDRGVPEDRMTLDFQQVDDEELKMPIDFNLYLNDDPNTFDKLQFTFKNNTFSDANFEFDSDVFRPGESFINYADSVKIYLDVNPEETLTIIGHTDSKGKDWYNNKLGKRRAESAKEYFRELGVRAKIVTKSEGEKNPADTNKTEEGRQKNRRVNFVLG